MTEQVGAPGRVARALRVPEGYELRISRPVEPHSLAGIPVGMEIVERAGLYAEDGHLIRELDLGELSPWLSSSPGLPVPG